MSMGSMGMAYASQKSLGYLCMSFSYGSRCFLGTARLTNGLPMCLARRNAALAPITFPM